MDSIHRVGTSRMITNRLRVLSGRGMLYRLGRFIVLILLVWIMCEGCGSDWLAGQGLAGRSCVRDADHAGPRSLARPPMTSVIIASSPVVFFLVLAALSGYFIVHPRLIL